MQLSFQQSAAKAFLAVAGVTCLLLSVEHFTHEYQPKGTGNAIPGIDHIVGPTLAEIPASGFQRQTDETPLTYVGRMTQLVHLATYHCAPTDHELSLIESATEAVMIELGRDPQRAQGLIDRSRLRCGLCSERAVALSNILRENGLISRPLGLIGHVATLVLIDGAEYLADPDYGVGPYLYNSSEDALTEIYLTSSLPKMTNAVVSIVVNRADDAPYYSNELFDHLTGVRWLLFTASDALGCILVAIGGTFIVGAARTRRRDPGALEATEI